MMSGAGLEHALLCAPPALLGRSGALSPRRVRGGLAAAQDGLPGGQVSQRQGQPGRSLRLPQRAGVTAGVDAEHVGDAVPAQRRVEGLVGVGEAVVGVADVERDQRWPAGHFLGQSGTVGNGGCRWAAGGPSFSTW